MKFNFNKNELIKTFILSFLFFFPKWFLSYYFFSEDITLRIIHEIDGDGEFYLPLMKSLTELDFTNIYSLEKQNNGHIAIPIGTLFLHSIFYFFIGNYSIILGEFIYIFLFIFFFSLIQKIYFERKEIVYISFLILLIPTILVAFKLNQFQFANIISTNFFGLRLHRPLGTTILLIIFIYITLDIFKTNLRKNNSFFLGLILGLTFSGFYYFFIIQVISIFILLLIKFNLKILDFIKLNFLNILIIVFGFLIFAIPFMLNILLAEPDFAQRAGVVSLSKEKKIILLKYYLELFSNLKFLSLILINSAIFFLFIKSKTKNILLYQIPFIIFISSIISPFLFFLISNKVSLLYHFNNNIIICAFISILFFIINFYHCYLDKKKSKFDYLIYLIIIFSIINISNFHLNKNKEFKEKRVELLEVTKILQKNNLTKLSILTFDNKIIIWSIMHNVKDLKIINGLLLPKKNDMIEKDIIMAFKFLNFDSTIFSRFIENKQTNWRYFNTDVSNFFYARYQANKFKTYNDSVNFTDKELNKISKSPPSMNQQFILPLDEIKRLQDKFNNNYNSYEIFPDYIIFNKSDFVYKNLKKFPDDYCNIYDKNFYLILSFKNCN